MSILQWGITQVELDLTPSRRDGCSPEEEINFTIKSIHFIKEICKILNLNSLVVATACVYYHRFFARHSYRRYHRLYIATICVFIASKVEETPRKMKDILITYSKLNKEENNTKLLEELLVTERVILQALGFELQITHTHILSTTYLKELRAYIPKEFSLETRQTLCNLLNDSYYSSIYLKYPPEDIAKAIFILATLKLSISPESTSSTSWLYLLNIRIPIDEQRIHDISSILVDVYKMIEDVKWNEETKPIYLSLPNTYNNTSTPHTNIRQQSIMPQVNQTNTYHTNINNNNYNTNSRNYRNAPYLSSSLQNSNSSSNSSLQNSNNWSSSSRMPISDSNRNIVRSISRSSTEAGHEGRKRRFREGDQATDEDFHHVRKSSSRRQGEY